MATSTEHDLIGRDRLRRWALRLAYATIAWNVIEAVVAITAGRSAGSIGLISFGLDSTIEVASASVVVWQFRGGHDEQHEHRALRAIALSFFALAAYATVQSVIDLATHSEPEASTPGIVIAALSLIVMPALAFAKRRVGHRLGSRTVVADSAQTMLCTYLSAALLAGLLGNAVLGWWWTDPLVALVVAALATLEGREAWHGETDDCCTPGLDPSPTRPAEAPRPNTRKD